VLIVYPTADLVAEVGGTNIKLRVAKPDLQTVLRVLEFNGADKVFYKWEPQQPSITGVTTNG
jgi:hypothetical protein